GWNVKGVSTAVQTVNYFEPTYKQSARCQYIRSFPSGFKRILHSEDNTGYSYAIVDTSYYTISSSSQYGNPTSFASAQVTVPTVPSGATVHSVTISGSALVQAQN